ncbi:MAG: GGDEF domain-containing protein, partial [Elusimicrobia bacterium]|nr:GGDEF domain-containing protein [Candidatus Obscuribacterium magneticum]
QDEIQSRIRSQGPYAVLYMDLNNFKAFNDHYGFVRGDEAIQLTADLIEQCFSEWTNGKTFLGHVGGDDFVGLVEAHDVEALCENILRRFDQSIPQLYEEADRARGKIVTIDRKGNKVDVPIMGLAIAVVTNKNKNFIHPGEIALIAGELKTLVKMEPRSSYLIDRRTY